MAILRLSTAARNAASNGVVDLVDADAGAGKILVYDGAMPATPNTAVTTQTLLATVVLGDPAFGDAATGVAIGVDPASISAVATGNATWFRMTDNSGDPVMDGDVSATGGTGTMQISSTAITTGGNFDITALSYTTPLGTA